MSVKRLSDSVSCESWLFWNHAILSLHTEFMPGLYLSKPVGFLLITVLKTCKHQSGYLQMFFKIAVLEILQIAQGNICVRVFFNRVTGLQVGNFLKKRQVFSCEICEIFTNIFFTEHLRWLLKLRRLSYQYFPFHF